MRVKAPPAPRRKGLEPPPKRSKLFVLPLHHLLVKSAKISFWAHTPDMLVKILPLLMSPFIITTLLLALGLGTTITFASSHWLLA